MICFDILKKREESIDRFHNFIKGKEIYKTKSQHCLSTLSTLRFVWYRPHSKVNYNSRDWTPARILHTHGAAISSDRIAVSIGTARFATDYWRLRCLRTGSSNARRKNLLGSVKLSENSTRSLAVPVAEGQGVYIYTHTHMWGDRLRTRRSLSLSGDACKRGGSGLNWYTRETKWNELITRWLAWHWREN